MQGSAARASVASAIPLLLSVVLLVFGTNLQGVLLPILGHERGSGMVAISLFSAAWSVGFVLACLLVGRLLSAVGYVRGFALLALLSAISAALLPLLPRDPAWIVLRLLIGFCYGGLSAILEGWLLEQAGSGAAFAAYMIVNLLASLSGTLSLDLLNPASWLPFALMAGSIALSVLPVAFGGTPNPPVPIYFRPRLSELMRVSPAGAFGCFTVGLITGAFGGLGPTFGMLVGLGMRDDTLMLAANSLGGALAYAPVGLLGERVSRRVLLNVAALIGLAMCALLVLFTHRLTSVEIILVLGVFGFAQYPLYGLCVGLASAAATGRPAAQVASELLLLFGLGTIAGPLIGGQAMRAGAEHLFSFIAVLLVMLVSVTLAELRNIRTKPTGA